MLLLVGMEVSPKGGHFLAFGIDEEIGHVGRSPSEICRAVARRGGVGFAAHPFSRGSRMLGSRIVPSHAWTALEDGCCTGLELWSLTTDEAEGWRSPAEALRFLREPEAAEPPAAHLAAGIAVRDAPDDRGGRPGRPPARAAHPRSRPLTDAPRPLLRPAAHPPGLPRAAHRRFEHDRAMVLDALRQGPACSCARTSATARDALAARRAGAAPTPMGGQIATGPATMVADVPVPADLLWGNVFGLFDALGWWEMCWCTSRCRSRSPRRSTCCWRAWTLCPTSMGAVRATT